MYLDRTSSAQGTLIQVKPLFCGRATMTATLLLLLALGAIGSGQLARGPAGDEEGAPRPVGRAPEITTEFMLPPQPGRPAMTPEEEWDLREQLWSLGLDLDELRPPRPGVQTMSVRAIE
jgi:hypothetical protein